MAVNMERGIRFEYNNNFTVDMYVCFNGRGSNQMGGAELTNQ